MTTDKNFSKGEMEVFIDIMEDSGLLIDNKTWSTLQEIALAMERYYEFKTALLDQISKTE